MPDHLHWLFILGANVTLQKTLHCFKGRSARRINQRNNRHGAFWQRAYHDHALRDDEGVKALARYIIANPLRARLVEDIGRYSHWDAQWV